MRNQILLSASLALSVLSAAGQDDVTFSSNYSVELGKPYPVIDGEKRYFEVPGAVITIKNDGDRWFVQKLSSDGLTQVSMKQYEDLPKDLVVEYTGKFGDRLLFFYSLWDKENEREQLFYREVDIEKGAFIGKGTKILSIEGKVSGTMNVASFFRAWVTDKFDFIFSADDERLLVQYARRRDKKAPKKNELSMAVFGPDLELQWKADVQLPYEADHMQMKDYTIDSNGDVCIIASVYTGVAEKLKDRKLEDSHYEFLRCSGEGTAWTKTRLELENKRLLSIALFEDGTGALRAAGFYAKTADQEGADGIFVCGFDHGDDIQNLNFHEIPTELLNMYVTKKEVKRNAKEEEKGEDLGFRNMEFSKVIFDTDGSILLVGERRYITVQCTTDSRGNTRCYDVYHADDMLVSSLDPQGGLTWMRRIPKRQSSSAPMRTTYKYLYGNGVHHFVRFDNAGNLNLATDQSPGSKGDMLVVVDRVDDASGAVTREAILNPDEVKGMHLYQLSLERLIRTSDGELLMEAYKKKNEDVLVRIALLK